MNPDPPVTNTSLTPPAYPPGFRFPDKRRTPWKGPVAHHSERDQDSPHARRDTPGIGGLTPVVHPGPTLRLPKQGEAQTLSRDLE